MGDSMVLPAVIVVAASLVAAVTDVWRFKVYNALTFPLCAVGLGYHVVSNGQAGLMTSLGGLLFTFGVLMVPYLLGALGAGDVKFASAVGAWLGFGPMVMVLVIGCLAAGVYAVVLMIRFGGFREAWFNLQLVFLQLASMGRHFSQEDRLETVQEAAQKAERRRRLVPFSAMVTVGILLTIVIQWFLLRARQ